MYEGNYNLLADLCSVLYISFNTEVQVKRTGLMSRCKKPTEWMLSMASKICLPSLKVVETEKVPRAMVLRKSARFLPCGQETVAACHVFKHNKY